MDEASARAEALAFMKSHSAGVLATASQDSQPHASAVYYVCDDKFNIYFFTLIDSRKRAAISQNPKVAFTVGVQDTPQTVQIEGVAIEVQNPQELSEQAAELIAVLTSNSSYYGPITQLDRSMVVLMWVQPKWVRWADYAAFKTGNKNVFAEIPLA